MYQISLSFSFKLCDSRWIFIFPELGHLEIQVIVIIINKNPIRAGIFHSEANTGCASTHYKAAPKAHGRQIGFKPQSLNKSLDWAFDWVYKSLAHSEGEMAEQTLRLHPGVSSRALQSKCADTQAWLRIEYLSL